MTNVRRLLTVLLLLVTGTVIGAVTQHFASAEISTGDRLTFVPYPGGQCRLTDTRPASNIGPRVAALIPGETLTIQATGSNGQCTVPTGATALSMNVTAVGANTRTFLTFWPDGPRPLASSLNPAPGQPPTPNAVKVNLSPTGSFNVYNNNGFVNVLIDVDGWFEHHNHDDRYSMGIEHASGQQDFSLPNNGNNTEVRSLVLNAPVAGYVSVTASGWFHLASGGLDAVDCSISNGPLVIDPSHEFRADDSNSPAATNTMPFSSTRFFEVPAGATTFKLVCREFDPEVVVRDTELTAVFIPNRY